MCCRSFHFDGIVQLSCVSSCRHCAECSARFDSTASTVESQGFICLHRRRRIRELPACSSRNQSSIPHDGVCIPALGEEVVDGGASKRILGQPGEGDLPEITLNVCGGSFTCVVGQIITFQAVTTTTTQGMTLTCPCLLPLFASGGSCSAVGRDFHTASRHDAVAVKSGPDHLHCPGLEYANRVICILNPANNYRRR